jgi:hypothetical protein
MKSGLYKQNNEKTLNVQMPDISQNKELKKYWAQRYRLFSKFDKGIRLDYGA